MVETQSSADGRLVRSVIRALALLSAVVEGPRTLSALARDVQISLSTAARLLGTLKEAGFVSHGEDGTYVPGPGLTRMIFTSDQWASVRPSAVVCTKELHALTNETCAFFVRTGHDRLCIESVESQQLVRRVCPAGERGPIYLGAAGKALLAFGFAEDGELGLASGATGFTTAGGGFRDLSDFRAECCRIRDQGFAYSEMESTSESWAIAVPVYHADILLGVLAVIVPVTRADEAYISKLAELARKVAHA